MQPDEIKSECSSGRLLNTQSTNQSLFSSLSFSFSSALCCRCIFLIHGQTYANFRIFATLHNGKLNFQSQNLKPIIIIHLLMSCRFKNPKGCQALQRALQISHMMHRFCLKLVFPVFLRSHRFQLFLFSILEQCMDWIMKMTSSQCWKRVFCKLWKLLHECRPIPISAANFVNVRSRKMQIICFVELSSVHHLFSDETLQTSISIWLQLTEIHNPNPSQSWDSASQSPDLHLPILHR